MTALSAGMAVQDRGGMSFFEDIALFAIDEVHVLNEERGAAVRARGAQRHAAHSGTRTPRAQP